MHSKVLCLSLLSSLALASTVPHLPIYEVDEYSSVDRVVDAGKVVLKGALGIWTLTSALTRLEKFLDGIPEARENVRRAREHKRRYSSDAYASTSTYAARMPLEFMEPVLNLVVCSAFLYITVRLAKSAWRNFKQATQSTPVQRYTYEEDCCRG